MFGPQETREMFPYGVQGDRFGKRPQNRAPPMKPGMNLRFLGIVIDWGKL